MNRRTFLGLLAALPFVRWLPKMKARSKVYVWDGRETLTLAGPYESLAWDKATTDRWIDLVPNDGRFHVLNIHRHDGVTTTYVNGERVS